MTEQKETIETGVAFRAGVQGLPFNKTPGPRQEIPLHSPIPIGPIERHFESIERVPGLTDPMSAYETGRALRSTACLMDREYISLTIGRRYLEAVVGAAIIARMKDREKPFGPEDVLHVFSELFGSEWDKRTKRDITRKIMRYARNRPKVVRVFRFGERNRHEMGHQK